MTTVDQPRVAFVTQLLPWLLTAGGAVGFTAAFVLTVEKFNLLRNPDYIPTCSIDPILSCGSIMRTRQAELFGFPNPLLGIAGFAVVITVGVSSCLDGSGSVCKRARLRVWCSCIG